MYSYSVVENVRAQQRQERGAGEAKRRRTLIAPHNAADADNDQNEADHAACYDTNKHKEVKAEHLGCRPAAARPAAAAAAVQALGPNRAVHQTHALFQPALRFAHCCTVGLLRHAALHCAAYSLHCFCAPVWWSRQRALSVAARNGRPSSASSTQRKKSSHACSPRQHTQARNQRAHRRAPQRHAAKPQRKKKASGLLRAVCAHADGAEQKRRLLCKNLCTYQLYLASNTPLAARTTSRTAAWCTHRTSFCRHRGQPAPLSGQPTIRTQQTEKQLRCAFSFQNDESPYLFFVCFVCLSESARGQQQNEAEANEFARRR